MHIVVGHSLLIHTPSRIKRILTGNPTRRRISTYLAPRAGNHRQDARWRGSSLDAVGRIGQNRTLDVYADLDVTQLP